MKLRPDAQQSFPQDLVQPRGQGHQQCQSKLIVSSCLFNTINKWFTFHYLKLTSKLPMIVYHATASEKLTAGLLFPYGKKSLYFSNFGRTINLAEKLRHDIGV